MVPRKPQDYSAGSGGKRSVMAVCVLLAVAVFLVFGQTVRYKFINYDDDLNVYKNVVVTKGLTPGGVAAVFKHSHSDYWHPLTFLSHMLDCQFYGLNAGGHHLTNVLLHAATVVLLFLVLRRLTGALWPSAFVAAVFAIHPLRVESVAWVSERKDILSGLFVMLAIAAYVRYVEQAKGRGQRSEDRDQRAEDGKPKAEVRPPSSVLRFLTSGHYWLVVMLFALALMSKPTVMTLPVALLLLDYWPLGRVASCELRVAGLSTPNLERGCGRANIIWRPAAFYAASGPQLRTIWWLFVEKVPFLVLSAASCIEAALGNRPAFATGQQYPAALRTANALVSYATYLWQMVYPAGLAVSYPFPEKGLPLGEVLGALVLLGVISAGAIVWRRRHPYLLVGWLWYLIMLLPMAGFIQGGTHAQADRYTYLPQLGLYLIVAWAAKDLTVAWRYCRQILGVAALGVIAALMADAWVQTSYWRNDETLWKHALACASRNHVAHNNLGAALHDQGRLGEAVEHYQRALEIKPGYAEAHHNLGLALEKQGRLAEAIRQYQEALKGRPGYADAHNNLGVALDKKGALDEAICQFQKALEVKPDHAAAQCNLGFALYRKGLLDESIVHYEEALRVKPDFPDAHNYLGSALARKGYLDEAIAHFQEALRACHELLANRD